MQVPPQQQPQMQHPLMNLTPQQQQQLMQQHPQYVAQMQAQQQAIYQQQMQMQHQTYSQLPKQPQYEQQPQPQMMQHQMPPQMAVNRFYPNSVSLSPKHQLSNLYAGNTANFTAATLRRPPQQHAMQRELIDAIPNSTVIDNAMYERDKQIYKCSTLRPGVKFDKIYGTAGPGGKPSILNCPLPEIPKDQRTASMENGDPTSPANRSNGQNIGVVHPTMTR